MISKILVPTDGSKASRKAAAYAVDLARQLGAAIVAVSVIDKRLFLGQTVPASKTPKNMEETVEDYLRDVAGGYLGEIQKLCTRRGVDVKAVTRMGYPVEEILGEARKSRAHLIVMGSRGRSALSATVLGSVSYGVLHNGKSIPVLIVRG
ncbi:MAG: universal stress protein [Smithellaceae bacterium]|nr:universal stress protein [Syntrophaceae bacterium]MDD4241309.1 universal stress protein [Smithellaceae bacterium]NLX52967.1 universal stress protein [Deltaproteobacteria bacterium]